MPRPTSVPLISSINFYSEETNQSTPVGTFMFDQIGRGYRYNLNGGVAQVKGNLQQARPTDTQFDEMAITTATAIGGTVLTFTNGTTTIAANDFKDGVAAITSSSGIGQVYRILSHTTGTTGATGLTVTIEDPLETATTTSSKLTIRSNPYALTVVAAGPVTAAAVGGSVHALALSKYGWLQTKGVGSALSDATVTAASTMGLSPSAGTAGAVTKHVNQDQYIGRSLVPVNVSAKVFPVIWQLD